MLLKLGIITPNGGNNSALYKIWHDHAFWVGVVAHCKFKYRTFSRVKRMGYGALPILGEYHV